MRTLIFFLVVYLIGACNSHRVENSFREYFTSQRDSCEMDHMAGDYCQINLKQFGDYYINVKGQEPFVHFTFGQERNDCIVASYGQTTQKPYVRKEVYIIYDEKGTILHHMEVSCQREEYTCCESGISIRDSLLKVYTFDSLNTNNLDHKYAEMD